MKRTIHLYREDDPGGQVSIHYSVDGDSRQLARSWPNQDAFLAQQTDWANDHPIAAVDLALACYLATDPTGANPALIDSVATEFDPAALTIVRRSAAL